MILDKKALERLQRLGGEDLVVKIIDSFSSFSTQQVKQARLAVLARQTSTLQKAAHSIRSSAGNVGALRLVELAALLEQSPAEDSGRSVQSLFEELEACHARVIELLQIEKQAFVKESEEKP